MCGMPALARAREAISLDLDQPVKISINGVEREAPRDGDRLAAERGGAERGREFE